MKNIKNIFIPLISVCLIIACAAPSTTAFTLDSAEVKREQEIQKEMALKQSAKYKQKLNDVSYSILKRNTDLCGNDVTYYDGLYWDTIFSYNKDWRKAATTALGLGSTVSIVEVVEGSPGDRAGIKVGDIVLGVNDLEVGIVTDEHGNVITWASEKDVKNFFKTYNVVRDNKKIDMIKVLRGSEKLYIKVTKEKVCAYPVLLDDSDVVNAYANGSQIVIAKGMMRFVEDDNELALVIAHELGHNAMRHMDKKQTNALPGLMLDLLSAYAGVNTYGYYSEMTSQKFSQEFETEADYVALYYLYRAGFKIDDAAYFWRRMAADNPSSIATSHSSTHPSGPERFLRIEKTIDEINLKIKNGEKIKPDLTTALPSRGVKNTGWGN